MALHPSHQAGMRRVAVLLALLALGVLLAWALPVPVAARGLAGYLPLHTLLETASIVIASLVFVVGWNNYSGKQSFNLALLGCVFLGVACLDFTHTFSFYGMPDFVTPNGPDKAIYFWLAARALAAVGLLVFATLDWQRRAGSVVRFAMLGGVALLVALLHWLFLFRLDSTAGLFLIPGKGLTPLKAQLEYAIIATNLGTALALWLNMRQVQRASTALVFGAVCTMAMGEFYFTLYAQVTDIFNLLGHVYKLTAYLFIFRAFVASTIVEPYKDLSELQSEQQATLDAIPDLLIEVDADGRICKFQQQAARRLGMEGQLVLGQTLSQVFPAPAAGSCLSAMGEAAAHGRSCSREFSLPGQPQQRWFGVTAAPRAMPAGSEPRLLLLLRDITQRKAAEEEIQSLAFSDRLTGLPNRRLLMDRLAQAMVACGRHQRLGALLLIDLDDFKTLNDTLGHDQGDLLLQQVGQRILECVRDGDTVARLGSDEFVVLLEDLNGSAMEAANQSESVGHKILASLAQPYPLADVEHHSTASLGVTLFGSVVPESVDEAMKRADLAMSHAKAEGRNSLRFFDPYMQAAITQRATLEAALREALDKRQFVLHYQAQVQGSGELTGVEALVRWLHPLRGMVSPAEFIPLAEENGLILPLGQWVLQTACEQLATWSRQAGLAHLSIAVNVSARQFHQRDFVSDVLATLARAGANPRRLKLELTESLLVRDVEDVIEKMSALKAHGVGFSLDDFGTGYSSLSYLKRLPLDQLKIDQSFVRDILLDADDAAIARMIVALANSLGLAVIAEGVETEAQKAFLAAQGCDAYQGYLFSRPLPVDEFESLATRLELEHQREPELALQ